jgi:DNA-directed RNA polymerase subunit M/transcription elongation factor TFIIS
MIKTSEILEKVGNKTPITNIQNKLKDCKLSTFVEALRREGMDIMFDKKDVYVKTEADLHKVADRLNNRIWMSKIARHRVYEDCLKCKHLDEENHLGKAWCDKWDTDIWNVSTPFAEDDHTTNKACVPFRYFGYSTPDDNRTQTQYRLKNVAALKKATPKEIIAEFVDRFNLKEVGQYFEDGLVFVGQINDNMKFGIRYNPDLNQIEMAIDSAPNGALVEASFATAGFPLQEVYPEVCKMWVKAWNNEIEKKESRLNKEAQPQPLCPKCGSKDVAFLNVEKEGDIEYECEKCKSQFREEDLAEPTGLFPSKKKAGADQHGKAPRQERSYDWINPEDYKKRHSTQKSKQYETSPSNTGEKYPTGVNNSFSESDRDVGNLI